MLSTTALELLRRRVLAAPLRLPPGFALEPVAEPPVQAEAQAEAELLSAGAAVPYAGRWTVHPAVRDDLLVLALPELAVTVRAARPGLSVTACLAVNGPRGACLLRTSDTAVRLSAFAAADLVHELAAVVPAPVAGGAPIPATEVVPLAALLDGIGSRLRGRVTGTLHASVVRRDRLSKNAGAVGSVEWVWDGTGWTGLQALPSVDGRPQVRQVPVGPEDLGGWLAPLLAAATA